RKLPADLLAASYVLLRGADISLTPADVRLCQRRTSVRLATALYPCRYTSLFRMRHPQVWKLLEDVGVRLEARGRTLIFSQKSQAVIDQIVSEDPAVRILCQFRWIKT